MLNVIGTVAHPIQFSPPLGAVTVIGVAIVNVASLTSKIFKSAVLLILILHWVLFAVAGIVQFCDPSLVVLVVMFIQVTPLSKE